MLACWYYIYRWILQLTIRLCNSVYHQLSTQIINTNVHAIFLGSNGLPANFWWVPLVAY